MYQDALQTQELTLKQSSSNQCNAILNSCQNNQNLNVTILKICIFNIL